MVLGCRTAGTLSVNRRHGHDKHGGKSYNRQRVPELHKLHVSPSGSQKIAAAFVLPWRLLIVITVKNRSQAQTF
jgi:hypothetical protein